jgi:hypothetical protein
LPAYAMYYFTREHVLNDAWTRVDEFFRAN